MMPDDCQPGTAQAILTGLIGKVSENTMEVSFKVYHNNAETFRTMTVNKPGGWRNRRSILHPGSLVEVVGELDSLRAMPATNFYLVPSSTRTRQASAPTARRQSVWNRRPKTPSTASPSGASSTTTSSSVARTPSPSPSTAPRDCLEGPSTLSTASSKELLYPPAADKPAPKRSVGRPRKPIATLPPGSADDLAATVSATPTKRKVGRPRKTVGPAKTPKLVPDCD
ncbi:hypothetical protein DFS34DRAFT_509160 [Phlyctochytrium arcticum]|nr:hypothetical protein DFS34DRAFT_509160 [Phlyctochytrium arcticum]